MSDRARRSPVPTATRTAADAAAAIARDTCLRSCDGFPDVLVADRDSKSASEVHGLPGLRQGHGLVPRRRLCAPRAHCGSRVQHGGSFKPRSPLAEFQAAVVDARRRRPDLKRTPPPLQADRAARPLAAVPHTGSTAQPGAGAILYILYYTILYYIILYYMYSEYNVSRRVGNTRSEFGRSRRHFEGCLLPTFSKFQAERTRKAAGEAGGGPGRRFRIKAGDRARRRTRARKPLDAAGSGKPPRPRWNGPGVSPIATAYSSRSREFAQPRDARRECICSRGQSEAVNCRVSLASTMPSMRGGPAPGCQRRSPQALS